MKIDLDALERDMWEIIAFPSVGGSDAEVDVQQWCADKLSEIGLDVDHWQLDLNALRTLDDYPGEEVERVEAWGVVGVSGPGDPALILNGHVDVVPPGDLATWADADPYTLRERGGRWFGRGACDMKAGVVAIIAAARAVRGLQLESPFAIHTVIGEEDGGLGTFATLQRGHGGEACVIAEPTNRDIVSANAGSLTFQIQVRGTATHGSMRHTGVSAVEKFQVLHAGLRELEAERNASPPEPFGDNPWPLSVGIIHAGDWASTVPDLLVAEGRYGVMPGESFVAAKTAFAAALAQAAAGDDWLRLNPPDLTWPGGHFAPGRLPEGHPLLDEVHDAAVAADCPAPKAVGAPYGSDLRQYAAAGIPTVQYGPGDVRHAHSVDEHVAIDEVVACAKAYANLIIERCGAKT
ncbi:MAG: ArgE/DapE family deacylase [Aeromicrobium sp.]